MSNSGAWQKIRARLPYLAGALFLMITVGNLIGEILVRVGTQVAGCSAYYSAFGLIDLNCNHSLMQFLGGMFVAFPRFITAFFFLGLGLIRLTLVQMHIHYLLNASVFILLMVLITFLIVLPGFRFWHARSPWAAWALMALFVVPVLYKAMHIS